MQETLTYTKSFTEDSVKIFKNNNLFLKVFNPAWTGWAIDCKIDGTNYRITRKGLWVPKITVKEKATGKEVAYTTVRMPLFGLSPTTITKLFSGETFEWKQKGLMICNWSWWENDELLISAKEQSRMFSLRGEIVINKNDQKTNLLIGLGLYLRMSVARQKRVAHLASIMILATILIRWILGS